jgi:hypothetical protein
MIQLQERWRSSGCVLEWLYGGAERFKWVHDTAGGLAKAALRREIQKFDRLDVDLIRTAAAAVAYLQRREEEGLRTLGSQKRDAARVVKARFYHLVPDDVLNSVAIAAVAPVKGTLGLHAVRPCPTRSNVLLTRTMGCGCTQCIVGNFSADACNNAAYVDAWNVEIVVRRAVAASGSDVPDGDELAADDYNDEDDIGTIVDGSIVAIAAAGRDDADFVGNPFWLLKVTKAPYKLKRTLSNDAYTDEDGKALRHVAGTTVVQGNWVQQSKSHPEILELWNDSWVATAHGWVDGKRPWADCPTVILDARYVLMTDITLAAVSADKRARLAALGHPGECFTLPPTEQARLDYKFSA